MALKWFWSISLVCVCALGREIEPSLTLQASAFGQDRLSPGGLVRWEQPNWTVETGARIGVTPHLNRLDSVVMGGWQGLSPVVFRFRLHHQWLKHGSHTALALTVGGGTSLSPGFRPYGEVGILRRYFRVGGGVPLPGPWGFDTAEWDAVVRFGFQLPTLGGVSPRFGVTTLDPFEVYRLNNPAAELGAHWQAQDVRWDLAIRYRLILGFGRVDEVAVALTALVLE